MSEHLRPEDLDLPHEDHEACISINGIMRAFSTADSAIWVYPQRYKMFNRVIKWLPNDEYECWFGLEDDDIDALHEAGVTMITPPYPSEDVVSQWWQVEMRDYDRELEQIATSGEIPPSNGMQGL